MSKKIKKLKFKKWSLISKELKTTLRLLTWQTSLIIISIGFLILTGVVTVTSSKTREAIQESAIGIVSASLSSNVKVKLIGNIEGGDIFFYDLINGNGKKPLKLEQNNNKYNVFKLPPGKYRLVILKEGYEQFEKEIVISTEEKNITIEVNLVIPEKTEDPENESKAVVNDLDQQGQDTNEIYDSKDDRAVTNNAQIDFELESIEISDKMGNFYGEKSRNKNFDIDDEITAHIEFDEIGDVTEGIEYKYEVLLNGSVQAFGRSYYYGNKTHSKEISLKSTGTYEFIVWVDPKGEYKESNENNNYGSIKFTIEEEQVVVTPTASPVPIATEILEPTVTIVPTSTPVPTATLIPTPVPTIIPTATAISSSGVRIDRIEIIDSNGNIVSPSNMSLGMYTYKVYLIGYDEDQFENIGVYGYYTPIVEGDEFPGNASSGYLVRNSSSVTAAVYKANQFSFSNSKAKLEVWADLANYDSDSQINHWIITITEE